MHNLDRALSDIATIRDQLARDTIFRGLGPATLAASGALAALAGLVQPLLIAEPAQSIAAYLGLWMGTALLAAAMIGVEAVRRAHRIHCGVADDMLRSAIEQFLPAAFAAALLSVVIAACAPHVAWLLPGLWQILMSLGVFASCRALPRRLRIVAFWYLATGLACVASAPTTGVLAPWTMGVPFGVGQVLAALLLRASFGDRHATPEADGRFAYDGLDRVIHEKARLGVLTSLVAHPRGLVFSDLKRLCDLTDGNLARHLQVLMDAGLVKLDKGAAAGRPQTTCRITGSGRTRYFDYLAVLEQVVRDAADAQRKTGVERAMSGSAPA